MSNRYNVTPGHIDRITGSFEVASLRVEDATAIIRRMKLTPADCVTLLNVLAGNLSNQMGGLRLGDMCNDPRMLACELLDACADKIYDIPKFQSVSCSNCGGTFGAGNNGFSHCENHANLDRKS